MDQTKKNQPVHTVRYGAIKATIWENKTASGTMFNVTVSRTYKDGEEWKESGSFTGPDLLTAAKALTEAHSWCYAQAKSEPEELAANG
jgi:hypothetical protein